MNRNRTEIHLFDADLGDVLVHENGTCLTVTDVIEFDDLPLTIRANNIKRTVKDWQAAGYAAYRLVDEAAREAAAENVLSIYHRTPESR